MAILYFTGTGNSRYIADRIAADLQEQVCSINACMKEGIQPDLQKESRLVFVVPTYGWRIPRVVDAWIRDITFAENTKAWFVMNCGDEIGNAAKYIRILCRDVKLTYMGTVQITMPENYIAMFDAPGPEESNRIIRNADPAISQAAAWIAKGTVFPAPRNNISDRIKSAVVNPVFYRLFVKTDAFRADDGCIGCGECVRRCPLNNIVLNHGRPVWGSQCTHCMACICYCPKETIEYGTKSRGKPRYRCESAFLGRDADTIMTFRAEIIRQIEDDTKPV